MGLGLAGGSLGTHGGRGQPDRRRLLTDERDGGSGRAPQVVAGSDRFQLGIAAWF